MGMDPCCCCSSRTGSLVIGVLEIVSSIFLIIVFAVGVGHLDGDGEKATAYVGIVSAIFTLFLGIFLVIGVNKEKSRYVKLWIGIRSVLLVANIIIFIVAACSGTAAETIAADLISIALSFWFLYVVYHFLKQLESASVGNIQDRYPANQP